MKDKIINYRVTLEAIGPVHVGSGTEINKKDCLYMTNEKRVYIMDSIKLFNGMKKLNLLGDYEKFLMDFTQKNLAVFIKNNNISSDEYKSWAAYTLMLDDISAVVDNSRSREGGFDTISAFVKDAYGCPYIPGSSLKGALRNAFENAFCEKNRLAYSDIAKRIENEVFEKKMKYLFRVNSDLSSRVFNTLDRNIYQKNNAVNDIFSFLRVSDSEPLDVSDLTLCQKIDVHTDGEESALPLKRECLKPGTKVSFSIEVDKSYMDMGENQIEISDELLYDVIDMAFENYTKRFLSVFKKISSVSTAAGHLIYIGGGSGFATKTSVYPLFDNRERAVAAVEKIMVNTAPKHVHKGDAKKYNVSPHIRKCTKYRGELYDMGICRIDIH